MTPPGRSQVWTGAQLTARLVALQGVAPEATQYALYRATESADEPGRTEAGYILPGETRRLNPASFDFWLAKRGLAAAERLSVAVLVVRERVAANGDTVDCALEYRRGAVDGPWHGSPARITFTGPAQDAHFFQATPDGRMTEIAPTPGATERPRAAGEELPALEAAFGEAARVVSTRVPTVLESLVGLASVVQVAWPDGGIASCGILWHGPIAVVLQAAFPQFEIEPKLSPGQTAALDALLAEQGMIACETRRDETGLAVVARRPAETELFLIRFDDDTPWLAPYAPGPPPGITQGQQQWLHYIETYEGMRVLDAYLDGASDELTVLTVGLHDKLWRHSIDRDGVETWRRADPGLAVAAPQPAPPHVLAPPPRQVAAVETAPFGPDVETQFPSLSYDIEEAARCLVQHRSTAAVFHCMRILEQGLHAHASSRGEISPLARGERRWLALLRGVAAAPGSVELHAALDGVRRAWRGATLQVGPKYTDEEAARIFGRVERFMRSLSGVCDEDGELPSASVGDTG